MKESKKQADDSGGLEVDPKVLEMGQAVRGRGKASERHGKLGDEP